MKGGGWFLAFFPLLCIPLMLSSCVEGIHDNEQGDSDIILKDGAEDEEIVMEIIQDDISIIIYMNKPDSTKNEQQSETEATKLKANQEFLPLVPRGVSKEKSESLYENNFSG